MIINFLVRKSKMCPTDQLYIKLGHVYVTSAHQTRIIGFFSKEDFEKKS